MDFGPPPQRALCKNQLTHLSEKLRSSDELLVRVPLPDVTSTIKSMYKKLNSLLLLLLLLVNEVDPSLKKVGTINRIIKL